MQTSPRYFFYYEGDFSGTLTNGSTTTISVLLSQNTIFEWHSLRINSSLFTSSVVQNTGLYLKITDQGTGQIYTSGYIPQTAIAGNENYGLGGELPYYPVLAGNTTIQFDILNSSGSSVTFINLTMVGIRENKVS